MQKNGALRVIEADPDIYDFFVNIENEHLLSYLSSLERGRSRSSKITI
ncbi:hypothetical protein RZN22_07805 [Bacillaceae bacterium S4-13-58]